APLTTAALTIAGMAMAFWRDGSSRVAVSFIGEGGSSLGEWHEAINTCAARRLPAVFCVENNQTALSTPVSEQSAVRVFADKAIGYGIPGITIDGADPDAIAAAFAWAAERARGGLGPTLIEIVAMRMCGHAHHDDMLYLGRDPQPSWEYPPLSDQGYADRELYEYWSARDPIRVYAVKLEAVSLGIGDALRGDPRVFVYGQDVGGRYGNAFLLLRPLLKEFGDRVINSPLAEGAVLGVCVGAALAGQRPIGEMQFNDFVATGFNQLVNNAAKIRYRWGAGVPMVVRMPWGGLRHAGPYHSQNTEPWFYRTPGLKIVVPSTPHDARALMASAVADPDPVLYYEHIALYRDPRIKQTLSDAPPEPILLGRAALRRAGDDLAIISYGAFVHTGMRVAEKLARDG